MPVKQHAAARMKRCEERNGGESEVWLIGLLQAGGVVVVGGGGGLELARVAASVDIPSEKHTERARSLMRGRRKDKHTTEARTYRKY